MRYDTDFFTQVVKRQRPDFQRPTEIRGILYPTRTSLVKLFAPTKRLVALNRELLSESGCLFCCSSNI